MHHKIGEFNVEMSKKAKKLVVDNEDFRDELLRRTDIYIFCGGKSLLNSKRPLFELLFEAMMIGAATAVDSKENK